MASRMIWPSFPAFRPKCFSLWPRTGIVSIEDLAYCEDWELAGGSTAAFGRRQVETGILQPFDVSLEEAGNLIMQARVAAGILDEADLLVEEEEVVVEEAEPGTETAEAALG